MKKPYLRSITQANKEEEKDKNQKTHSDNKPILTDTMKTPKNWPKKRQFPSRDPSKTGET